MSEMSKPIPADTRIAYGAQCTWWDQIQNATATKKGKNGVPCCPHCGGPLMETWNERQRIDAARKHERDGNPGYAQFVRWLKGKCYKTIDLAQEAYRLEGGEI